MRIYLRIALSGGGSSRQRVFSAFAIALASALA
jgi:hypothetical protein